MPTMTRFGQVVKDISEGKLKGTLHLAEYKPMTKDKWDKLDEVLPSSQITHLDASRCALDDTSQARFIQLVKKSVQLMVLNLSDNVIGERIVDLMDCINDHPHLADLRINNALTTMGFYLLANKLVKNKALKSLSIAHGMNTFDIDGMKTIMNLEKAVESVASLLNVLNIVDFFVIFFESSSHHYGEKKITKKDTRFNAVSERSSFQLLFLG